MTARFMLLRARAPDAERAGVFLAEAHAAGASGALEREIDSGGSELLIYAPEAAAPAVATALRAAGVGALSGPEPVPDEPWEERWKEGLALLRISPRLAVRPPSVPDDGSGALVIEPGQAFGTGSHESTRLALRALDALAGRGAPGTRVLDVGTGSGILALAALQLGAERAVGFDLDRLAAPAARVAARRNGLAGRLLLFTGPVDALAGPPFDCILANLLRTELEPVLPRIAATLRPGGYGILSGLLAEDEGLLAPHLAAAGLAIDARLSERDAEGATWVALTVRRE